MSDDSDASDHRSSSFGVALGKSDKSDGPSSFGVVAPKSSAVTAKRRRNYERYIDFIKERIEKDFEETDSN